jgi:hypothetical protein
MMPSKSIGYDFHMIEKQPTNYIHILVRPSLEHIRQVVNPSTTEAESHTKKHNATHISTQTLQLIALAQTLSS